MMLMTAFSDYQQRYFILCLRLCRPFHQSKTLVANRIKQFMNVDMIVYQEGDHCFGPVMHVDLGRVLVCTAMLKCAKTYSMFF